MKIIPSLLIALTISSAAFGKEKKESMASAQLQQIMKDNNTTGLAVAVVKDGKVIFVEPHL